MFLIGKNNLSKFYIERKKSSLKKIEKNIEDIKIKNIFFIKTKVNINNFEITKLQNLLSAKNIQQDYNLYIKNKYLIKNTKPIFITPRIHTVSSWSSKAKDIIKNCNINIRYIECFQMYLIKFKENFSVNIKTINKISGSIFDKMTQSYFLKFDDINAFFANKNDIKKTNVIDIINNGKVAIEDFNNENCLNLSNKEIEYLYKSFLKANKNPTDVEIMMFSQVNSEHCRHKIFKSSWKINNKEKKLSLFDMIKSTFNNYDNSIISAYDDNSAIIKGHYSKQIVKSKNQYKILNKKNDIQIKVETHNHPTAISPYEGAATGVGGEIRDEIATGIGGKTKAGLTGYTVSNLFIPGKIRHWEKNFSLPNNIKSALEIMINAPLGGAGFGNEFGRPNILGYFRCFEHLVDEKIRFGYHKPIMLSGGYGSIFRENSKKIQISENINIIVLGGPGMLIGLGGGSSSSVQSSQKNKDNDFASVQRDNPEMQRRAYEVINNCLMQKENPIISIHDVGAGGLSNAVPEIIYESNIGGSFTLQNILVDQKNMSPLEIWANESQERFVLAISDKEIENFKNICKRENCPFSVIGKTNLSNKMVLYDNKDNKNLPININLSLLFENQDEERIIINIKDNKKLLESKENKILNKINSINIKKAIESILSHPTVSSKKFLITITDRTVGGLTCRDQMIGKFQIPVSDYASTSSGFFSKTGEAMSIGERPVIAINNPGASARISIGECITNIAPNYIGDIKNIKMSANWMASCSFEEEKHKLFIMVNSVKQICREIGITIPVGKDSLFMSTKWKKNSKDLICKSPVSLVVSGFSPIFDINRSITPELKIMENTSIMFVDLGLKKNRIGGSILSQIFSDIDSDFLLTTPDIETNILTGFFISIQNLIKKNKIIAYHDKSDGGLISCILEMMFTANCSFSLKSENISKDIKMYINQFLFNEELGCVIQVKNKHIEEIKDEFKNNNICNIFNLGRINIKSKENYFEIKYLNEVLYKSNIKFLESLWSENSFKIQEIRDNPYTSMEEFNLIKNKKRSALICNINDKIYKNNKFIKNIKYYLNFNKKPKVAILREQGTNSHIEMSSAFIYSGFDTYDVNMFDIKNNISKLSSFNGIAFCGGFSFGDVLGAGTGWSKSILFNDILLKEFKNFFERKTTFSLGVCNGCQMLSKLKNIIPGASDWPEFVVNKSERFEARLSSVKIIESKSILFKNMENITVPIVVSHAEGQTFFIKKNMIENLNKNNQICMKFVDSNNENTEIYPINPNGSTDGNTGFTSKDGRSTIMMPHPERTFRTYQMSWVPNEIKHKKFSPWINIFNNARVWLK